MTKNELKIIGDPIDAAPTLKMAEEHIAELDTILITIKEWKLLKQAMRIATEDGSLSEWGSDREIQALTRKLSYQPRTPK